MSNSTLTQDITTISFEEALAEHVSFSAWTKSHAGETRYYVNANGYASRANFHFLLAGYAGTAFSKAGSIADAVKWNDEEGQWVYASNTEARKGEARSREAKIFYNEVTQKWSGIEDEMVINALQKAFEADVKAGLV